MKKYIPFLFLSALLHGMEDANKKALVPYSHSHDELYRPDSGSRALMPRPQSCDMIPLEQRIERYRNEHRQGALVVHEDGSSNSLEEFDVATQHIFENLESAHKETEQTLKQQQQAAYIETATKAGFLTCVFGGIGGLLKMITQAPSRTITGFILSRMGLSALGIIGVRAYGGYSWIKGKWKEWKYRRTKKENMELKAALRKYATLSTKVTQLTTENAALRSFIENLDELLHAQDERITGLASTYEDSLTGVRTELKEIQEPLEHLQGSNAKLRKKVSASGSLIIKILDEVRKQKGKKRK